MSCKLDELKNEIEKILTEAKIGKGIQNAFMKVADKVAEIRVAAINKSKVHETIMSEEGTELPNLEKPELDNSVVAKQLLDNKQAFVGSVKSMEPLSNAFTTVPTELSAVNLKDSKDPLVTEAMVDVEDAIAKVEMSKKLGRANVEDSKNDIGRAFVFDNDGKVNSNMAVAIMAGTKSFLMNNLTELTSKPDYDTVNDYFPSAEPDALIEIMNGPLKRGGIPIKFAAEEIGAEIVNMIGIKLVDGGNPIAMAQLKTSLGGIALAVMAIRGEILEVSKDNAVEASMIDPNNTSGAHTKLIIGDRDAIFGNIEEIRDMAKGMAEEFGAVGKEARSYHLEQPEARTSMAIHNQPYVKASSEHLEAINIQEAMSYEINSGMELLSEAIENNLDKVKENLGYIELNDETRAVMGKDAQDSQEAINGTVENSIQFLLDMHNNETVKEQSKVWFKWFVTKGGRFNLDSTTVNPQTDKLHRFIVTASNSRTIINPNNIRDKKTIAFMYSIVQAFDGALKDKIAIDKTSEKKVLAKAKELLKMKESTLKEMMYEADHIGHAAVAIANIKKFNEGKEFQSDMTLETDGLTNGFAFRVMQFPLGKFKEFMTKVGVIPEGHKLGKYESMNAVKDSGETDTYQMAGSGLTLPSIETSDKINDSTKAMFRSIEKAGLLPNLEVVDGKVSKGIRDLMKSPVMVFNYSAGLNSIRKAVTREMKEGMIDKLLDKIADKEITADKFLDSKIVGRERAVLIEQIGKLSQVSITHKSMRELNRLLDEAISNTLGEAVTNALETHFKEYIEFNRTVNDAFSLMYQTLHNAYLEATANKNKDLKVTDKVVLLNSKEKIDFVRKFLHIAPSIKTAVSKDINEQLLVIGRALEDIDKTITEVTNKLAVKPTGAKWDTSINSRRNPDNEWYGDNGTKTVTIQTIIRSIGEPGNSGSVIPIHMSDGITQALTIIASKIGYLGVHDAQVLGLDQTDSVKDYNKNWYELNRDYSILDAIINQFNNVLKATEYNKGISVSRFNEEGDKVTLTADAILDELIHYKNTIDANRKEIFSQNLKVGQMVGPNGLMYEAKAKESNILNKEVVVDHSNKAIETPSYGVKERLWNTTSNSKLIGPMKAHIDELRKNLQVQVVKANKDALRYVFDKVKEDVISVLENEGKKLDSKVVAGEYDPHTNIAYIADRSVMTGKSIKDTIKEAVADVLKDEGTYSEENMTKVMEAQKDTIEKIENNIAETLSAVESSNGKVTTILHELVHAGTQIFIEMNPNSSQVKELSSIFDRVKEMMPEISKKLDETDVYWKTDLHEFAAEAMSNPELIKVLASIQYNKETVLEKVLRVISNMMGVKSETLYSAMTNVVADIVRQDVSEYEKLLGNASRATVEERAKAAQTLLDMSAEIQNKIIGKIKDCK